MSWNILVDFDGTIARDDTTDLLLERFATPEWHGIEAEWVAGRIGSRECMARQIDLVRATRVDFDDFVAGIEIDRHFRAFVRLCEKLGLKVSVVSDGLDSVIHAVLRQAGLGGLPVFANRLSFAGGDRWSLSAPYASDSCMSLSGTCKCAVAARRDTGLTLVIGDGRSDHCVAEDADFVFAKSGLIAHCQRKRLPYQPFRDFADVTLMLGALVAAELEASPAKLTGAYKSQ